MRTDQWACSAILNRNKDRKMAHVPELPSTIQTTLNLVNYKYINAPHIILTSTLNSFIPYQEKQNYRWTSRQEYMTQYFILGTSHWICGTWTCKVCMFSTDRKEKKNIQKGQLARKLRVLLHCWKWQDVCVYVPAHMCIYLSGTLK